VAYAAGAPARQQLMPFEARQAGGIAEVRRRRGRRPAPDALRVSDVAWRSHEHPACVPALWVLREQVMVDGASHARCPASAPTLRSAALPAIAPAADEQGADCHEHADLYKPRGVASAARGAAAQAGGTGTRWQRALVVLDDAE
jgi:hypothetical protein